MRVVKTADRRRVPRLDEITDREVLQAGVLLAKGYNRSQAADEMDIAFSRFILLMKRMYDMVGVPDHERRVSSHATTIAVARLVARGDIQPWQFIDGEEIPHTAPGADSASRLVQVRMLTTLDPDLLKGLGDAYRALVRAGL